MSFTTIEQAHRQAAEREEKRNPLASKMSLRDHFAAKVMPTALVALWEMGKHETPVTHLAAQFSYEMADAMLKAREA